MTVNFVVETMEVQDGKKLQSLKPDEDGYFCGMPMAVVDAVGRNDTFYYGESVQKQLTDPNSGINISLQAGGLFGEMGHPRMTGTKPDMKFLQRICDIVENNRSHHIKKIYTAEKLENGGTVIRADIKPFGKYKDELLDGLMDPHINQAFSLRSLVNEKVDRAKGIIYRYVTKLITFDAVNCGGFKEASKRFTSAMESIAFNFEEMIQPTDVVVGLEQVKDKELLSIFGAKDLVLRTEKVGLHIPKSGTFIDDQGNCRSIFHQLNVRR